MKTVLLLLIVSVSLINSNHSKTAMVLYIYNLNTTEVTASLGYAVKSVSKTKNVFKMSFAVLNTNFSSDVTLMYTKCLEIFHHILRNIKIT